MKLLYIYDQLPSGYQQYMSELLDELKKKVDVKTLSYYKNDKADFTIKSYRIKDKIQRVAYKTKLSSEPSLDIKIMKDFDIIHFQHSYLFPKITPFLNSKNKLKIIITLRGGDTYIKPWVNPKWKDFYANQSTHIDAFITVSEHQKSYLQKWGIPKNKIHVIPVSFGKKANAKPKFPSEDKIKIVSAHRMCWEKNIESNLRVIKILKEKGQSVQYDVYGDGPDKGQLLYLIDKYNLNDVVNYLGKVENKVFKNRLHDYDFFLQLSHSEAFGASVIEAQSMGVPAIISNAGGLPETILENKSGYCVDSWDVERAVNCIVELYSEKEKYFQFSKKAIENSNSKFTTQEEVNSLLKLYNRLT
ncbi:MAG: hypothetical protein COB12_11110 [Flavobacterium sp.]|nr:MAG: hypothetical protein COB12_11110 [Flavobacterium sp.]